MINNIDINLATCDYIISIMLKVSPSSEIIGKYYNECAKVIPTETLNQTSSRILNVIRSSMLQLNDGTNIEELALLGEKCIDDLKLYYGDINADFYKKFLRLLLNGTLNNNLTPVSDKIELLNSCIASGSEIREVVFAIEYYQLLLNSYLADSSYNIPMIQEISTKLKALCTERDSLSADVIELTR